MRWKSSGDPEVWKAWKRAWDLWNNHYILGRVNPKWIKEELARRRKERSKVKKRKWVYGGSDVEEPSKVYEYHFGDDPLPPPAGKGRKWVRGHFYNVPPNIKSLRRVAGRDENLGERFWELVDDPKGLKRVQGEKRKRPTNQHVASNEDETLDIWWSNAGDDEDGNSGGLRALKSRAEYDGEGLEDKVANTVWRPLKVGEEEGTAEVMEFDDWRSKVEQASANGADVDGPRAAGELEIDGGVDCGSGPYPVSPILAIIKPSSR
jgi:hypothetical protein